MAPTDLTLHRAEIRLDGDGDGARPVVRVYVANSVITTPEGSVHVDVGKLEPPADGNGARLIVYSGRLADTPVEAYRTFDLPDKMVFGGRDVFIEPGDPFPDLPEGQTSQKPLPKWAKKVFGPVGVGNEKELV